MNVARGAGLIAALAAACGPGSSGSTDSGTGTGAAADAAPVPGGPDARPVPPLADAAPLPPDAAPCVAETVEAEAVQLPADIIWAVDTSGSMGFEASTVESNLAAFAAAIDSWGIDYQVVMVAAQGMGDLLVCVPPPLGGAACADGPRYRHVNSSVGSNDSFERLIAAYPSYQDVLREDSVKHFVVVTDDQANWFMAEDWFLTQTAGLGSPGFPPRSFAPDGFIFHSIVAFGDIPFIGCVTGAAVGQQYLNLTEATGGVAASICETDWTPIFDALAESVIQRGSLPCELLIPPPPEGETLDLDEVNVVYTPSGGGAPITLPRVDGEAACTAAGGWYYDDPDAPTRIIACPASCDAFAMDPDATVDLALGCASVVID